MQLNENDRKKVNETLTNLKAKSKKRWCRHCGELIQMKFQDDRLIPFDLDDTPHWKTCPYSGYVQKKCSFPILKKMALHFSLKLNTDLENEVGLTKHEVIVVRAILENMLKTPEVPPQDSAVVIGDLQFKPIACDSIGDPDEDRAPNEELIHAAEEIISTESSINVGIIKATNCIGTTTEKTDGSNI